MTTKPMKSNLRIGTIGSSYFFVLAITKCTKEALFESIMESFAVMMIYYKSFQGIHSEIPVRFLDKNNFCKVWKILFDYIQLFASLLK